MVVEAVFDDLELKTSTFAGLGRITRPQLHTGSNTSTGAHQRPGIARHPSHFLISANVTKLVEIVHSGETAPRAIATSQRLAKRLGKVGVVIGNGFRFVANRTLANTSARRTHCSKRAYPSHRSIAR